MSSCQSQLAEGTRVKPQHLAMHFQREQATPLSLCSTGSLVSIPHIAILARQLPLGLACQTVPEGQMYNSVHGHRGRYSGPQSSAEIILDYRQVISYYVLSLVCRPIFTCYVISKDSGVFMVFIIFQKKCLLFLDK